MDDYLRDTVSIRKDVEGLSNAYRRNLYHNIRYDTTYSCCIETNPACHISAQEMNGDFVSQLWSAAGALPSQTPSKTFSRLVVLEGAYRALRSCTPPPEVNSWMQLFQRYTTSFFLVAFLFAFL